MRTVLHINCLDSGSTGKLIDLIADTTTNACNENWVSHLCSLSKSKEHRNLIVHTVSTGRFENEIYQKIGYIYGFQYGVALFSTWRIIKIIKEIKPDIVHFHSANCHVANLYKLFAYLKKNNIAIIITNHAEFYYTGNCSHSYDCNKWKTGCGKCNRLFSATESRIFDTTHAAWKRMKNALCDYDRLQVVSVSPWVYSRSAESPILAEVRQSIILNGIDEEVFRERLNLNTVKKYNLDPKKKILLHVTAGFDDSFDDIKGGRFIIELAKKIDENISIIIAGKYKEGIVKSENIVCLGKILDQNELAELYSIANLVVISSKAETFSMPVAESLCCGTPVVGFNAGGPVSIALQSYSEFCEYGNMDALILLVKKWIDFKDRNTSSMISEEARVKYSGKRMAQEYLTLYYNILNV